MLRHLGAQRWQFVARGALVKLLRGGGRGGADRVAVLCDRRDVGMRRLSGFHRLCALQGSLRRHSDQRQPGGGAHRRTRRARERTAHLFQSRRLRRQVRLERLALCNALLQPRQFSLGSATRGGHRRGVLGKLERRQLCGERLRALLLGQLRVGQRLLRCRQIGNRVGHLAKLGHRLRALGRQLHAGRLGHRLLHRPGKRLDEQVLGGRLALCGDLLGVGEAPLDVRKRNIRPETAFRAQPSRRFKPRLRDLRLSPRAFGAHHRVADTVLSDAERGWLHGDEPVELLAPFLDGRRHRHVRRAQIIFHRRQVLHRAADQVRRLAADAGERQLPFGDAQPGIGPSAGGTS